MINPSVEELAQAFNDPSTRIKQMPVAHYNDHDVRGKTFQALGELGAGGTMSLAALGFSHVIPKRAAFYSMLGLAPLAAASYIVGRHENQLAEEQRRKDFPSTYGVVAKHKDR